MHLGSSGLCPDGYISTPLNYESRWPDPCEECMNRLHEQITEAFGLDGENKAFGLILTVSTCLHGRRREGWRISSYRAEGLREDRHQGRSNCPVHLLPSVVGIREYGREGARTLLFHSNCHFRCWVRHAVCRSQIPRSKASWHTLGNVSGKGKDPRAKEG